MSKSTVKKAMKNAIIKEEKHNKTYDYRLDGKHPVHFNFTLRDDNVSELKPFLRLLKDAVADVEEDIKKITSKVL